MLSNATLMADAALLEQYTQSRDAEAFAELVRRYAGFVYGTALRVMRNPDDAEDVAQECFLELARKADSVTSSLPGWLHTTARHRSINAIRNARRRRRYERQTAAERRSDAEPTWDDIAPYVDEALDALPEELRVPIILHYFEGHSQSQIASQLSVSQPTVSRRLDKGVAELRRRLKAAGVVSSMAVLAALLTENAATAAPDTLMISLGKMAIAGVGKAGSGAGVAASAGSAGSSSASPTTLVGTLGGKIALGVAAGGIILAGAMAVRYGAGPPRAPAADIAAVHSAAPNREATHATPGERTAGERPTPTGQVRRGDAGRIVAAPPGVPRGDFGMWKAGPSNAAQAGDTARVDAAPRGEPAGGFGMWEAEPSRKVKPGDGVLQALTAKAAIRDCHYRLEWTTAEGVPVGSVEVWYAGLDRMRVMYGQDGEQRALQGVVVNGEDAYEVDPQFCEVARLQALDARRRLVGSLEDAMPILFLTREMLAVWPEAVVNGSEAVAGALCHVVALRSIRQSLSGDLTLDLDDFVAFVPRVHQPEVEGHRFWVDGETGLVRRWAALAGDRVQVKWEVTETQQVNGVVFPSQLRRSGDGAQWIGQVTQATVNEGIAADVFDFRPPPNWLMRDRTLTEAQARERLLNDPDDAGLHYTLGRMLRPNDKEAAEEFRRAAELAPDSPTPLLALGESLQLARMLSTDARLKDEDEIDREGALNALRDATARAGDCDWEVRKRLAEALTIVGALDEAIAEYRKLMAAGPPRSYAVAGALAQLLARKGDHDAAYRVAADVPTTAALWQHPPAEIVDWAATCNRLDDLRAQLGEAVGEHPKDPQSWLLLARVLHVQGRGEDAVEALKRVPLTLDPAAVVALAGDLGEKEWAVTQVRPAVRQALESRQVWVVGNLSRHEELRAAVAAELRRETQALWTDAADVRSRVALLGLASDVGQDMYRPRGSQLVLDPKELTPAECAIVAAVDFRQTMFGDRTRDARRHAAECLQRALTAWPDDGALWQLLGALGWWGQDWEAAAEGYGKAAASDPEQIGYAALAAFALVRLGRCEEALDAGRKAIEPWPDEWVAQAFFAALQMDCAEFEAAREALVALRADSEVHRSGFDERQLTRLLERCHQLRVRRAGAMAAQGDLTGAKALADELRGEAGDSLDAWREVAEVYLAAQSWDESLAAAERMLALSPATDQPARMRAEVLIARVYAAKQDHHEARRRLMRVIARARDPVALREAADLLANIYLRRDERDQAIATLNDLRLRTDDADLLRWIDERVKEIVGE